MSRDRPNHAIYFILITVLFVNAVLVVGPAIERFYGFSREGAIIDFPGAPFLAAALLVLVASGQFVRAAR